MNADGSGQHQVTKRDDYGAYPTFSPDGKRIVFTSWDDAYDISIINADGTGEHRLTASDREDLIPDWSPNGKQDRLPERPRRQQRDLRDRTRTAPA